ncbi:MAG: hypothetical protein RL113_847 [Pseudomonadota bacterium]
MYYLLNETSSIIGADQTLLDLCDVSDIDELSVKIALKAIHFDLAEEELTLTTPLDTHRFIVSKIPLSSLLGEITLVTLQEINHENEVSEFSLDEPLDLIPIKEDEEETPHYDATQEEAIPQEDSLREKDDEILHLTLLEDDDASNPNHLQEIIENDDDQKEEALSPSKPEEHSIRIDVEKISKQIGISTQDYHTFFNEFVKTADTLKDDLLGENKENRSHAITTLTHLSDLLQLPVAGDIISQLPVVSEEEKASLIDSFYTALAEIKISLLSPQTTENPQKKEPNSPQTLSLEKIKPIYFDFRIEEAANELSLPVSLIEEFIVDFIQQCHDEMDKILKAYEIGDIAQIQEIANLLKGAANNLHIKRLADALSQIQFSNTFEELKEHITSFWGHLLSFEIQIHTLSQRK